MFSWKPMEVKSFLNVVVRRNVAKRLVGRHECVAKTVHFTCGTRVAALFLRA